MDIENFEIFKDIPTIKTKRLTLRKITKNDLTDIFKYSSDPEVSKYLLWEPHASIRVTKDYITAVTKKYKEGQFYSWGIEYDGRMIGTSGFSKIDVLNDCAEVGYVIARECWGRGIATEALLALLEFGFERLILKRIEAVYMTENKVSLSVMKKCGMKEEGIRRRAVRKHEIFCDVGICAIRYDEYYETKKRVSES